MNKKIITLLSFCISFMAHADDFTFQVKDINNKLIDQIKLFNVLDLPVTSSFTKKMDYIKSCKSLPALNDIASLSNIHQQQPITVRTFVSIIKNNNDNISLSYAISDFKSIKVLNFLNCSIQLPDIVENTVILNFMIKPSETLLVGEFNENKLFLTRD